MPLVFNGSSWVAGHGGSNSPSTSKPAIPVQETKSDLYSLFASDTIAPTTGPSIDIFAHRITQGDKSIQASVSGTGSVSATIIIEASNDALGWLTLATITLSGTTSATDGFVFSSSWKFIRARLTAISGTNAAVTATMAV